MANTMTSCVYSNTVASRPKRTTFFSVTMSTEENIHWKRSACFWHTKSSTRRIFSSFVAIMRLPVQIGFMGFTTSVSVLSTRKIKPTGLIVSKNLGKRRYNIKLWKTFTDCFNCMPIAAIIDDKIFAMHGGLSPHLQSMDQIRRIMRPTDIPDAGKRRSR